MLILILASLVLVLVGLILVLASPVLVLVLVGLQRSPDHLAGFKGSNDKGREGMERKERRSKLKGKRREGKASP